MEGPWARCAKWDTSEKKQVLYDIICLFVYLFNRVRVWVEGGGSGRGRGRETVLGPAQSPTRGSIAHPWDPDLSRNQVRSLTNWATQAPLWYHLHVECKNSQNLYLSYSSWQVITFIAWVLLSPLIYKRIKSATCLWTQKYLYVSIKNRVPKS